MSHEPSQPGVLHVLPQRGLKVGGPAYSVPRLADSQAQLGAAVQLWSLDAPELGQVAPLQHAQSCLWPASLATRHLRGLAPGFTRALRRAATSPQIQLIHNHGLWMFPNRAARIAAHAAGKPLVCSPRGMLEAWSLRRSAWSKRLAWWAFERSNLQQVALFHATSQAEAQSIRHAGWRQPITLIANGVDEIALAGAAQRTAARQRWGLAPDQRMLLFLSRLHEKKGLLPLLQAWKALGNRTDGWQLLLAGPDLDGFGAQVRQRIAELGLQDQVHLPGMLVGEDKASILAAADAFVLPSHSENFGIAVAEAAMAGLPVLTTHGTPWQALVAEGGGWQVNPTPEELRGALLLLLQMPATDLRQMGVQARTHVLTGHSWSGIAERMLDSYRWLLGRQSRPPWVHLA